MAAERPWSAGRGEVEPDVKAVATAFVERAGTWQDGKGSPADVAGRARAMGWSSEAAASAAVLAHRATAASVHVIYPQYGGLNARRASVMVLAEQTLLRADGSTTRRQLALDVRIDRADGMPVITGVEPPVPLGRPRRPSATARAVLADPNLVLAAPAATDVRGGHVTDDLLEVLRGLARHHTLQVQVFRTGHPLNVFDTDRLSNHTRGRAVDIRGVGGRPVTQVPRRLLARVMADAGRLGATEVGGPFDLNGAGTGYFTDAVHRDHLHIAVTPGRGPAPP